jgi:serine/threonine protein kinase
MFSYCNVDHSLTFPEMQLLSGEVPYGKAASTPAIWYILLQGKRPARPNTPAAERWITDAMWTFINEMTHVQPECRPTMYEVVARLERFRIELDPNHDEELELEAEEVNEDRANYSEGDEDEDEDEDRVLQSPITPSAESKGVLRPILRVSPVCRRCSRLLE